MSQSDIPPEVLRKGVDKQVDAKLHQDAYDAAVRPGNDAVPATPSPFSYTATDLASFQQEFQRRVAPLVAALRNVNDPVVGDLASILRASGTASTNPVDQLVDAYNRRQV